jgi:hypothetical protein
MEKKYVLVGGLVRSKTDGQIHYVSAHRLARLYMLDKRECYFVDGAEWPPLPSDLTRLFPRYDGDYRLAQ